MIDGFPKLKAFYTELSHAPEIEKWYAAQKAK